MRPGHLILPGVRQPQFQRLAPASQRHGVFEARGDLRLRRALQRVARKVTAANHVVLVLRVQQGAVEPEQQRVRCRQAGFELRAANPGIGDIRHDVAQTLIVGELHLQIAVVHGEDRAIDTQAAVPKLRFQARLNTEHGFGIVGRGGARGIGRGVLEPAALVTLSNAGVEHRRIADVVFHSAGEGEFPPGLGVGRRVGIADRERSQTAAAVGLAGQWHERRRFPRIEAIVRRIDSRRNEAVDPVFGVAGAQG